MKNTSRYALAMIAATLMTAGTAAQAAEIKFKTNGGLKWETDDGEASGQFGGRVMVDGNYFDEDQVAHDGGFEFRRLRLFAKGQYLEYAAKIQLDFAGSDVDIKDAYISREAFGGTIKGGHFKQPFGLEELTSSKYITFIERGFGSNGIATSRKLGLGYNTYNNGIGFAASVYSPENIDGGNAQSDGSGLGARLTWAPHTDLGNVTHFGIAAASESNVDFGADLRPEAHLASKYTMIDVAMADVTKLGVEGALVRGPFSLQGEYMTANADPEVGSEETLNAYYAQVSYFLTSDTRPYKAKAGSFDRVKPSGNGAWEVALRYDGVENDDTDAEADAITFGVNYYATKNVRWMFNLITANMTEDGQPEDSPNAAVVRWQLDF